MPGVQQYNQRWGAYNHIVTLTVLSQDVAANTTRIGYTYDVVRDTNRTSGAWTFLNNCPFTLVLNGVPHTTSPDFDFRGPTVIRFLAGEQTVTHGTAGTASVSLAYSTGGVPGSSFLVAGSVSGLTFEPTTIPRASTFTVTPNPVLVGSDITIAITRANSGFTHTVKWHHDEDEGTIGTGIATATTFTPDEDWLGSDDETTFTIEVITFNGATQLGSVTKDVVLRALPEYPEIGIGTPYDIRFRRTELAGSDWLIKEPVEFVTASFSDPYSATATCEITATAASAPLENQVVALDVYDGSQWISTNLRFVMTRVETDRSDLSGVVKYTGISYVDYMLSKGISAGERNYDPTTPAHVMYLQINEAKDRGWGAKLGMTFTPTKTSVNTNWTTGTVDQTVAAGTTMIQTLEGFVNDVMFEYRTSYANNIGRLDLYNPGYGFDWTVAGSDPVVNLATAALFKVVDKAPVRKDYSDLLTRVLVEGDETSRTRESASAVNPMFGHLEGSVQASGVKDATRLNQLGDAALANQASATVERTFSYDLSSNQTPTALYPYRTFRPGDWVLVPGDNGLERVRVAQVSITRSDDGTKATITVGDLIPSGIAATARKLTQATGGAVAGGSMRSPDPLASAIPLSPENIVTIEDGYWNSAGAPRASVQITWDEVTQSVAGTDIIVDLYEVWVRDEIGDPWKLFTLSGELITIVDNLPINASRDIKMRARSQAGVYGEWSDIITFVTPEPDELLPAPSTPITESDAIGTVSATWDGLLDGVPPPLWFAYLRAEISDDEFGGYSYGGQQLTSAGTITIPHVGEGEWWVHFVPVDVLGNDGAASDAAIVNVSHVSADARQPATPDIVDLYSEGYWDLSEPQSRLFVEWDAVTQDVDGDPIDIALYEVWGRLQDDGVPHLLGTAIEPDTSLYVTPIGPLDSTWFVSVRAMGTNNVMSEFSEEWDVVILPPEVDLGPPSAPHLESWRGLLLVSWDGNLVGLDEFSDEYLYPAPSYMANIDVEVSTDGGGTFKRMDFLTRGERSTSIGGLGIGTNAVVRFRGRDRLNQVGDASETSTIEIVGIDGADILANTIGANHIITGSIQVNHVAPGFGAGIDIEGNVTITAVEGQVTDLNGQVINTVDEVAAMRTRYDFTPSEAIISQPGSPFQVSISNTQMEFREAGVARAFLNAGVFNAPKMASGQLVLQYHVIQNDPDGTVMKRL